MQLLYNLLLLGNFISAITLAVIAPFFPPLAKQQGLSEDTIGFILSANPFGAVVCSVVLGHYLNKINRGQVMIGGLVLQTIGLFMFIFTEHLEDANTLLVISLIARIIQGGLSAFLVPSFAYIPLMYPDQIEEKISQMEACTGIGYIVGPLIGGLLFSFGGYKAPFLFFSLLLFMGIPVLHKTLKSELITINLIGLQNFLRKDDQALYYGDVFKSFGICLTAFILIFSTFSYMYFEPVQANFFMKEYNIEQSKTGLLMTVSTFTYIGGTIFLGQFRFNKKRAILIGMILTGFTFFFQGPDVDWTPFSKNLDVVLISQAILGIASALIFIPGLPLLNSYILEMYPDQIDRAGNMASSLFTSAVSAGELIGPLAGGFMTEKFGYSKGCSYIGFIILFIALIYGVVVICEPKMFRQRLSPQRNISNFPEPLDLEILDLSTLEEL